MGGFLTDSAVKGQTGSRQVVKGKGRIIALVFLVASSVSRLPSKLRLIISCRFPPVVESRSISVVVALMAGQGLIRKISGGAQRRPRGPLTACRFLHPPCTHPHTPSNAGSCRSSQRPDPGQPPTEKPDEIKPPTRLNYVSCHQSPRARPLLVRNPPLLWDESACELILLRRNASVRNTQQHKKLQKRTPRSTTRYLSLFTSPVASFSGFCC